MEAELAGVKAMHVKNLAVVRDSFKSELGEAAASHLAQARGGVGRHSLLERATGLAWRCWSSQPIRARHWPVGSAVAAN